MVTTALKALSVIGALVLLSADPLAGAPRQRRPALESLTSRLTSDGIEFTIASDSPVEYRYFRSEDPSRLIVDFLFAENRLDPPETRVGRYGVLRVRAARFETPEWVATRVVFDLEDDAKHFVDHLDARTFRVRFGAQRPTLQRGDVAERGQPAGPSLEEDVSALPVRLDNGAAAPASPAPAAPPPEAAEAAREPGSSNPFPAEGPGEPSQTVRSPAEELKARGDASVAQERLPEAAEAYQRALSLGRAEFTPDERVDMAVYMSWDDRLDAALDELQRVLAEHPDHVAARAHLARVYSWSGWLDESIDQADLVLARSPEHPDALLVKADALEWQGHYRRAIPIYRQVLESDGDFAAGVGLSYALLSAGDRAGARGHALALDASGLRQQRQLDELIHAIDQTSRPRFDIRHNYYEDSDDNQSNRYALGYAFGVRNYDFDFNLTRTEGRNPEERTRSESASFSVRSNLAEGVAVGGGLGLVRPGTSNAPNLMTGELLFDAGISNGGIGMSFGTSVLEDTTELIENRIRMTRYGASLRKPVTDRLSLAGAYGYKDFSDGNHAHDVEATPEYILVRAPRVTLGFAFRFTDYRVQSGSGFFDPDNYVSNRVFGSFYLEGNKLYTYLNLFAGRQTFSRNGFRSDDFVTGGSASIGFTPTEAIAFEVNADGGNFSAGSVTGFRYFVVGSRLSIRF